MHINNPTIRFGIIIRFRTANKFPNCGQETIVSSARKGIIVAICWLFLLSLLAFHQSLTTISLELCFCVCSGLGQISNELYASNAKQFINHPRIFATADQRLNYTIWIVTTCFSNGAFKISTIYYCFVLILCFVNCVDFC